VTGAERRKHPRKVVDLPARCAADGQSFPAWVRDLCRDAALIEAHHECALDTRMVVSLDLPGVGRLEVTGRVIRLAAGEGDARGMALLFIDATPAAATRIDLFLSGEHD
jgi:PilZ domain-containing protein